MITSRKELIRWLKSLNIHINCIEEFGQGTAICHLLTIIHPNKSFNFIKEPSTTYEYLRNLKTAQGFFQENNIEVRFPIEKLVQCKLQDNLEFAQWMYKYYIKNHNNKTKKITNKDEVTREFEREKNRKEIVDNLKKHSVEQNTKLEDKCLKLEENYNQLLEKFKKTEEDNLMLKSKLGIFADNDVQKVIKELEENRNFYFCILVEIEKYLTECDSIEENVKNDIFNILYKKS
ncbi:hypothetical protein NCER_100495 [Vairimorpha ceranae BRL01]|uniref:Calponin-homology (CH) domain-containing protein n=2 Tax=Vairimorpha ceranae TaxID=40302 RepID=C4V7Q8_VAIC1|nr:microtubule binding protein [Vairimorpha ceranae]EEQ82749.1 hypothetical protein NCER_100495 [Vairimorpha ceranae BRL01]KAF5140185.1 hypothetical protein G9O61_00g016500 [Vairimorpha ceranae]KKO75153.1 microtubule binding protein [Vairimorpha ceranae]